MPEISKMTIGSSIFVRWKAKKVSFVPRLLGMTLLEQLTPLLGSISRLCDGSQWMVSLHVHQCTADIDWKHRTW